MLELPAMPCQILPVVKNNATKYAKGQLSIAGKARLEKAREASFQRLQDRKFGPKPKPQAKPYMSNDEKDLIARYCQALLDTSVEGREKSQALDVELEKAGFTHKEILCIINAFYQGRASIIK